MSIPRWLTRPNLLALALLGLSMAGTASCKNEGIPVDQYVDDLSQTVCTAVITCNCDYPYGALYEHCVTQLGVGGDTLAELNAVGGLSYDGECAQQAVDRIADLGCSTPVYDPNAECAAPCKIWHGPMGLGGTCTSINGNDNCKQGLVCDGSVCVDPCAEPNLPTIGQPCSPSFGCAEEAYCDGETIPLSPTCVALPGVGEDCIDSQFGWLCAEDLVCDQVTDPGNPTCAALPGIDEECPNFACAEGLYCDTSAAPAICAAFPTLGDDCPFGVCTSPYVCDEGVCVQAPPAVCGMYGGLPPDDGGVDGEEGTDTLTTLDGTDTLDGSTLDGTDTFDGTTDTGGCGPDEWECPLGGCIPLTWVCDGIDDCGDNSDEASC